MPENRMTTRVDVVGAEKGAGQLDKVGAAQKRASVQTAGAQAPLADLTANQEEYNDALGNYTAVGADAGLMLGAYRLSTRGAVRAATDFTKAQQNLGTSTGKTTSLLARHAGALKLVGVAGAVTVGIMAITKAYEVWAAAVKKLADQEERRRKARGAEALQIEKDVATVVQRAAEARRGGLTSEQQAEVYKAIEAMSGRLAAHLWDKFLTNLAILAGDQPLGRAFDLAQAGITLEPGMHPRLREREAAFRERMGDAPGARAREQERFEGEKARELDRARQEAKFPAIEGRDVHLERLIAKLGEHLSAENRKYTLQIVQETMRIRQEGQTRWEAMKVMVEGVGPRADIELGPEQEHFRRAIMKVGMESMGFWDYMFGTWQFKAETQLVAQQVLGRLNAPPTTIIQSQRNYGGSQPKVKNGKSSKDRGGLN